MKNKSKGFVPVLILFLVVVIVAVVGCFAYNNYKSNYQGLTTTPLASPISALTPVYIGNYDVDVKISADSPCNSDIYLSHCKSDIYLKDKTTGKETFVLTTDDVVRNDTRVPQYREGYIFLVKRIGYDDHVGNYQGPWSDELWVYVSKDKGKKIYDSQGLNYSVSQDASLVALLLYEDNDTPAKSSVTLLSRNNNWQAKQYPLDTKQCNFPSNTPSGVFMLDLEKWQQNPSALWGVYSSEYRVIGCYWKLDPNTANVVYYPVPDDPILFALNTDKLVALYTNYPPFVDADSAAQWKSTNPTYSLYLYSLKTQKSIRIDNFPTNFSFDRNSANWKSSTQFSYLTPNGMATYTIQGQ